MTTRMLTTRDSNGASPFAVTFPSLTRVFGDFFNDPFFTEASPPPQAALLPLDVSEDDTDVIVRASLPGYSREDVDVQIHDGVLSISAQRSEATEAKSERYHRRERRSGSFTRQVSLPTNVVSEQTHAELRDGVLTLRIPKTPEAQPKKIKIG